MLMQTITHSLVRAKQVTVSIIGAGVVGKATGMGLREVGHRPIFFDTSTQVQRDLTRAGQMIAGSIKEAVDLSGIVMVSVPTPTISRLMSLKHVIGACAKIGDALKEQSEYKLVVIRSTVLPGSTREKVVPIIEKQSSKLAGPDFGVCMQPEFLTSRNALQDFLSPDRIVIGEIDTKSGDILERFYRPFGKPIVRCSLEEAELIKYVCNAFLAAKISFFNEVFSVCRKSGANPKIISHAAGLDHRIGEYGVVGGRAFDGSCLPKDLDALITFVRQLGENPRMLKATADVNNRFNRDDEDLHRRRPKGKNSRRGQKA